MSKADFQNRPIVVGEPIEIEKVVNEIRLKLSELSFIDYPYFIAQRYYDNTNGNMRVYPETYAIEEENVYSYAILTPDNDYKCMFFAYVGQERVEEETVLSYPVSFIFSCNLELIDKEKLQQGIFTQELISTVRKKITDNIPNFSGHVRIERVSRDTKEVYREFTIDNLNLYNRAPLQLFRFDLTIKVDQNCVD